MKEEINKINQEHFKLEADLYAFSGKIYNVQIIYKPKQIKLTTVTKKSFVLYFKY